MTSILKRFLSSDMFSESLFDHTQNTIIKYKINLTSTSLAVGFNH